MRERLVAALVGMTVAVIGLYGVPRAYELADLVHTQEERKIERSVDLLAVLIAERVRDSAPVSEAFLGDLLNEAETLTYTSGDGSVVSSGPAATDAEPQMAMSREVEGGGTITLARQTSLIDQRVSDAVMPLVLLGLALTAASAVVGFLLARRMARPFQELAAAATDLGAGRFRVDVPHYAVPEAESIGEALRLGGAQLDELVRREREFASNASHQLRTPITALRLELEDLAQWPETTPTVSAQLQQSLTELDRLSEAIGELLGLARGHRHAAAVDLDLADVVGDTVGRWRPQVEQRGRRLLHRATGPVPARLTPGTVSQILDVLIENACDHGQGDISVDVGDTGTYLRVRVSDEGTRAFGQEVFRRGVSRDGGPGVGLTVAAELAESLGGWLTFDDTAATRFVLMLPRPGAEGRADAP